MRNALDEKIRLALIDWMASVTGCSPPVEAECIPPEMRAAFQTLTSAVLSAAVDACAQVVADTRYYEGEGHNDAGRMIALAEQNVRCLTQANP